jgi:hypothetical protein
LTDAPVAFFSSFFFTKLCRHGHEDPALKNKYSYEEVAGWTRKTFRTRSIDKMKTTVFFRNLTLTHRICYAIFLDLRIIQAFDLMGGSHPSDLKALYCWFQEMTRIAGKKLGPAKWCLYGTCPGTPQQIHSDCGLYTVLFRLCVAKRYFLRIVNRERITAARCLLLLKIIGLEPKNAKPLLHGPVGRKHKSWILHPFHYVGESLPYSDVPFSTFLKNAMKNSDKPPPDGSNGSGSDHNNPPKLLCSEDKQAVVNLMTPSQPTDLAVTLDLTTSEQKRLEPLVTTPEKDAEADSGETNDGK